MNVRNVWMSDDRSGLMFPREAANGETREPSRAGNEPSRHAKFDLSQSQRRRFHTKDTMLNGR